MIRERYSTLFTYVYILFHTKCIDMFFFSDVLIIFCSACTSHLAQKSDSPNSGCIYKHHGCILADQIYNMYIEYLLSTLYSDYIISITIHIYIKSYLYLQVLGLLLFSHWCHNPRTTRGRGQQASLCSPSSFRKRWRKWKDWYWNLGDGFRKSPSWIFILPVLLDFGWLQSRKQTIHTCLVFWDFEGPGSELGI